MENGYATEKIDPTFESGLCKNGHEAPLQAWPECRADVRTDSEAVPRETKAQTSVRTRLAPDSWIPPIRRNNFRRPPVTECQTGAVKLASGLKDDYRQICANRQDHKESFRRTAPGSRGGL